MTSFIIKAFEAGKQIKSGDALKVLRKHYPVISTEPLMLALSIKRQQYLLIAPYGVAAASNWSEPLEQKILNLLTPFVVSPCSPIEYSEEIKVVINPQSPINAFFDKITIPSFDEKFVLIVGTLLMQSVGLESYERKVDPLIDKFNQELLKLRVPRFFLSSRSLTKNIIEMIQLYQSLVAGLGILDKPEQTWEDKELDLLYSKFSDELELKDRTEILGRKIDLLKENMRTALDILNAHKTQILETTIVILILVEILIWLAELTF